MDTLESIFSRLSQSSFRRKFRLNAKDRAYLQGKGVPLVMQHAEDFIQKRLAPALPANDGRQTPWHGHPVFVAQHATACCCRGCLEKWHRIPKGQQLTPEEIHYILTILRHWLERQSLRNAL